MTQCMSATTVVSASLRNSSQLSLNSFRTLPKTRKSQVLGSKRGIPERLMNDFNATGLTHIVAISGYNITMLVLVIGTVAYLLSSRASRAERAKASRAA